MRLSLPLLLLLSLPISCGGTDVEAGEKLAELDVSTIEEKRAEQAIAVARVEAALLQARKGVEIMGKELRAAENTAASRLKIARLRMQKFLGQTPVGSDADGAADNTGTNADMIAKLRELLDDVAHDEAMAQEAAPNGRSTTGIEVNRAGLLSKTLVTIGSEGNLDLEMGEMANLVLQRIDEISYKRQLSQVTVAWNNLSLLVKYTLPETLITLEQEVENAELQLESVRASGEARRVREQAELKASEAEHGLACEQLDNLDRQILNGVLYAPTPGLVVYGRWDWDEPVYEGMEVRERQEIVILPDIESMQAELRIHEAQIGKLAVGQTATVRVDAFPSRTFGGRVSKVATLPEPTRRSSDPKVFAVKVLLDDDNSDGLLRPSINGTVIIDVGTLENVIIVPLTAIERRGDDLFVWKVTPDGPVAAPIRLGGNNLTHIEILDGLLEGDRIHLVRPLGALLPAPRADAESAAAQGEEKAAAAAADNLR